MGDDVSHYADNIGSSLTIGNPTPGDTSADCTSTPRCRPRPLTTDTWSAGGQLLSVSDGTTTVSTLGRAARRDLRPHRISIRAPSGARGVCGRGTAEEITALREHTPSEWWSLFALLIHTGLRIGEAQALRWADVLLADRRLAVHERYGHRLKTTGSARDVPLTDSLASLLAEHAAECQANQWTRYFPIASATNRSARRAFKRAIKAAKLNDVTIHDLRHTFGVHSAQAGVPLARLQKLMGHSTPAMTMRYARHAPESYFAEVAERIAASLDGTLDKERAERVKLAREALKIA